MSRRNLIAGAAGGAVGMAMGNLTARAANETSDKDDTRTVAGGTLQQCVCQWCFSKMPVDDLCAMAKKIGLKGIDLVGPEHFATLKKHGLIGTMTPSHTITKGLNRKANHDECLAKIRTSIEATADAGFPNVICFSGNRDGMDDAEGLTNCAEALKQVVGMAEQRNVTIQMELLNSKRSHKDYMCDRTKWGAELAKRVGSERFKLLYDIYHMQVDEGDVIGTIRDYKEYIGHYHTAGVPGRNEIDENQELNYPAIVRAIVATGFKGYFAHEFIPKRDPAESLAQAARICMV